MRKLWTGMLVLIVAGVLVGVALVGVPATAQDGQAITFVVDWSPYDNGSCERGSQVDVSASGPMLYGFLEVITVRNGADRIVSMTPLDGEFVEGDVFDRCEMQVELHPDILEGPGYTVWHEDAYIASIPARGHPEGRGSISLLD